MKVKLELDADDLRELLAKMYRTDVKNVYLYTEERRVGYGPAENIEHVPKATITMDGLDVMLNRKVESKYQSTKT